MGMEMLAGQDYDPDDFDEDELLALEYLAEMEASGAIAPTDIISAPLGWLGWKQPKKYLRAIDPIYGLTSMLERQARSARQKKAARGRTRRAPTRRAARRGVSVRKPRVYYFGLGSAVFGVADITAVLLQTVQRRFRLERVVLVEVPTGVPAPGQVLVTSIVAGVANQTFGTAGAPIETFGATSTSTVLNGAVVVPGIDISVPMTRSVAPGGVATVIISGTVVGALA